MDSEFNNTGVDGSVFTFAFQSDDKIVLVGPFSHVNGEAHSNIARLEEDGTVDALFNPSTDYPASSVRVQPDTKLLIHGDFTKVNGVARNSLARINPDGSVEETFVPDSAPGPNAGVGKLVIQGDGKVLLNGSFTSVSGAVFDEVARLNDDGTLDTGFNACTGLDHNNVRAAAVRPTTRPSSVALLSKSTA